MTADPRLSVDGFRLEIGSDAIARLTLDRPLAGNAIEMPMAAALMRAVIACDEDPAVRCVLLTGSGRLFCAGGDVSAFSNAGDRLPAFLKEITVYVHAAAARLMRMSKPVVTVINGAAAGAGVGLALAGDIVLASSTAHFTLAYTGLGLSPDAGATWLLPKLVGLRKAQEIALLNPRISADDALTLGLVSRVLEPDGLGAEAETIALQLASGATAAIGATKRLLMDAASQPFEAHLDAESRQIAALAHSADAREGISAFIERRVPNFNGGV